MVALSSRYQFVARRGSSVYHLRTVESASDAAVCGLVPENPWGYAATEPTLAGTLCRDCDRRSLVSNTAFVAGT